MEPSGALALAQAYLRLDRPQEAAAVFSKVQDGARGPMLPLLYGEALEKSGKPDEAEEVYLGDPPAGRGEHRGVSRPPPRLPGDPASTTSRSRSSRSS